MCEMRSEISLLRTKNIRVKKVFTLVIKESLKALNEEFATQLLIGLEIRTRS